MLRTIKCESRIKTRRPKKKYTRYEEVNAVAGIIHMQKVSIDDRSSVKLDARDNNCNERRPEVLQFV